MDADTFQLHQDPHSHNDEHDDAAEAVLASLRAVINDPSSASQGDGEHEDDHHRGHHHHHHHHGDVQQELNAAAHAPPVPDQQTLQNYASEPGPSGASTSVSPNPISTLIERSLASLSQHAVNTQVILDNFNGPEAIQNLAHNLKALGEGNRKLQETVKELTAQIKASELSLGFAGAFSLDPELSPVVLREEYDTLKARYDALAAAGPATAGKRATGGQRKPRAPKGEVAAAPTEAERMRDMDPNGQIVELEGRKRRSIKLEHLVHQMANRRLGVEYAVTNFETKGTKDLPDPESEPVKAAESVNGVDEFRPNFKGDLTTDNVKEFIDTVVEDVLEAWEGGVKGDEPNVDRERIVTAVSIYWARLSKRYDEQLHRERGEIHRDELSRRKQNTYRRQQSLLARRLAAFDSSPLNACKLRALYRTLLTIDFAAPTTDLPNPKRDYTEEEWQAYRKLACGSRAKEAHEVIDLFWLSPNVRSLLTILDVHSADVARRAKKKGKPKQPNPTFHLPEALWDRSPSRLPNLRPKDSSGLPIVGAPGLVLFRFHVDERVQQNHPEWAEGLYDNPPIPDEDASLLSLPDTMDMDIYVSLKPAIREARMKSNPRLLTKEEVEEINARVLRPDDAIEVDQSILDPALTAAGLDAGVTNGLDSNDGEYMTFAALSRFADPGHSSVVVGGPGSNGSATPTHPTDLQHHTLTQPFSLSTSNPLAGLSGVTEHTVGPSLGSSMRARKLGKRMASQAPGGAATPVPKRKRQALSLGVDNEVVLGELDGGDGGTGGGMEEIAIDLEGDVAFLQGI
ncbi:hypothetical protein IAU60_000633 [Kwoniella sp. DSM 27419]